MERGAVERRCARGQDPGRGTGRAVVAVLVEARAAAACARHKLQVQAQAAQEEHAEVGARDPVPGLVMLHLV